MCICSRYMQSQSGVYVCNLVLVDTKLITVWDVEKSVYKCISASQTTITENIHAHTQIERSITDKYTQTQKTPTQTEIHGSIRLSGVKQHTKWMTLKIKIAQILIRVPRNTDVYTRKPFDRNTHAAFTEAPTLIERCSKKEYTHIRVHTKHTQFSNVQSHQASYTRKARLLACVRVYQWKWFGSFFFNLYGALFRNCIFGSCVLFVRVSRPFRFVRISFGPRCDLIVPVPCKFSEKFWIKEEEETTSSITIMTKKEF